MMDDTPWGTKHSSNAKARLQHLFQTKMSRFVRYKLFSNNEYAEGYHSVSVVPSTADEDSRKVWIEGLLEVACRFIVKANKMILSNNCERSNPG